MSDGQCATRQNGQAFSLRGCGGRGGRWLGHGDQRRGGIGDRLVTYKRDDGQLHYGVIRVTLLGFDQADTPLMIFDWAYQLQPGNPNLAPPRGG